MNKEELSFENAVRRLEKISSDLEKEGYSLDQSLALYEEGIKLVRYCNALLDEAERKITVLTATPDGEIVEKDFLQSAEN
jgi:exodeoxyribonuclease VII small subunit